MNTEDAVRLETGRAVQQRLADVTAYLEGALELVRDLSAHAAQEVAELEQGFDEFEREYARERAITSQDARV